MTLAEEAEAIEAMRKRVRNEALEEAADMVRDFVVLPHTAAGIFVTPYDTAQALANVIEAAVRALKDKP